MTIIDDWHDTADQWPLVPLMLGSLGIPLLIAYLSFDPSTRWLRVGLWPISVVCYFAALGRIGDPCTCFLILSCIISDLVVLDMRFAHPGVSRQFMLRYELMIST
jgi:hypothetical protein